MFGVLCDRLWVLLIIIFCFGINRVRLVNIVWN